MDRRTILTRTQAYERYLHRYGTELTREYNQFNGLTLEEVQLYVDPAEGKLHADVVLSNGARIPLLVDVDPDWELENTEPLLDHSNLNQAHETSIQQAAKERKGWEQG
jgi:hypothetical protein